MATRFYYPRGVTVDQNTAPAYSAEWNATASAVRQALKTTKSSTSITYIGVAENVSTSPYDVLIRQYISESLAAQTISGTVKGQMNCEESNADADFGIALDIKVVSEDGSTVRGTLLSYFPGSIGTEFSGYPPKNRYSPPSTAISSVECLAGDRIVVEIGYRSYNTHTTNRTGYLYFGDNNATDLPEDDTTTTLYNPWIEFSADLDFLDALLAPSVFAEYIYTDGPALLSAAEMFAEFVYAEAEGGGGGTFYRTFPLPPANRLLQSQDCRKWPRFKE